jgi:hypothetical protein
MCEVLVDIDGENSVNKPKAIPCFSAAFLILTLTAIVLCSLPLTRAASYSNVSINIQTQNNLPYSFTVSAFNASGYLLASCQTQYPAASFELPDGQYIFTATTYYGAYPMSNAIQGVYPIPYYSMPVTEYGYSKEQVSGSTAFTIQTQNASSLPKTTITVEVTYANGTAAEGASVSASILGSWYYWDYGKDFQLWTSTQADGSATLVTPQVPIQISAWDWIYIPLPSNITTVQVTIAGEQVNVTVYWQPTYVGLAGSALVIPPENNASITLRVQQPNYWVLPLGVSALPAQGGTATTASGQGSIPASVYQSQQGNPMLQNYQTPTLPEFPSTAVLAISFAATLFAIAFLKRKKNQLK